MTKEHVTGQENKGLQTKTKTTPKEVGPLAAAGPGLAAVWQGTMGNQAIGRLVGRNHKPIQAKMSLNAVNDPYEQEADSVAQQVVGQLNNPVQRQEDEDELMAKSVQQQEDEDEIMTQQIQRQEGDDEIMTKRIQRQEDNVEIMTKSMQRQEDEDEIMAKSAATLQSPVATHEGGIVAADIESRIQQAQGGQPLAAGIRQPMEQAFGSDFSSVRIHTNSEADDLNQSLQARAFTTGQDIFFKEGEYSPSNLAGQELLAHELTHVVQQGRQKFQHAQKYYGKQEKNSSLMRQAEGTTVDVSSFMVVVVGSPSPDQAVALQFVNAALQHPSNENVVWLVEKSGYELRAKKENKEENYYIDLIDSYAPLGGIRWFTQEHNMPEVLEEFSDNSILEFFVYSHGVPGNVALRYGWSKESSITDFGINAENIKQLNASKFAENAFVRFDSCNTGAENDSTTSLAQEISNQLGLPVSAWTGRTSYRDVNRGTGGVKGSEYIFDVRDSIKEFWNRWQFGDPELKTFHPQKENGTIIELPEIDIIGDPQFYTKALRVNQIYAKNPPLPGWPYDNALRQLWQQKAFDDFADQVLDIQEQALGLSGKNVDGILGPQTARLMNYDSGDEEPDQLVAQPELNSKEARMIYVMSLLVNKYNYPENSASGLVGNLHAESGLIANRVEGSKADTPMRARNANGHMTDFTAEDVMNRKYKVQGPKKPGVGLAQWTTKERREGLFKHKYDGVEQGANILFNLDAQVDYLVTELRSKYKRVNRILEDPGSSVADASDEVLFNFERPAKVLKDVDGKKKLRDRGDPEIQGLLEARRKFGEDALGFFQEANSN